MEEHHRKIIADNQSRLIQLINIDLLLPHLVNFNLFSQPMVDDFLLLPDEERRTELIKDLPTRGPKAFTTFIQLLVCTNQHEAAELLNHDANQDNNNNNGFQPPLDLLMRSLEVTERGRLNIDGSGDALDVNAVKPTVKVFEGEGIYKMTSNPRGHCLIINNRNFEPGSRYSTREGTEHDGERLKVLFRALYFMVDAHEDKKAQEMLSIIRDFATSKKHQNMDAAVVIILTHGEKDGIVGVDGKILAVDTVIRLLDNFSAPYLQRKPKLVFIQACRGEWSDFGVKCTMPATGRITTDSKPDASSERMHTVTDIIVSYSSVKDFVSVRDRFHGAWYVITLVAAIQAHAHEWELTEILRDANKRLRKMDDPEEGMLSTAEFRIIGFDNKFYFNTLHCQD